MRLSAGGVDDPHVARLLDGVAFLAARVHHRLDDEFPELTDALLGMLYPHYLAPVPSCMVARLDCSPDLQAAGHAAGRHRVRNRAGARRGAAAIAPRHRCTLWPIEVENIRLTGLPIVAPANPAAAGAVAALRITLKCAMPEMTFAQLGVDRLRFFLQGPSNQTLPLYELLGGHVLSVAFADVRDRSNSGDRAGRGRCEPAGFGDDEALLPWSARGFAGFRLLTEYFAFPEKFLFVDITGIDRKTMVVRRQPAGDFRLSRPRGERTGTHDRPAIAWRSAACRSSICSAAAASRSRSPTRRPNIASSRTRDGRSSRKSGVLNGCGKPGRTVRTRPWRPFHRLTEADPIRTRPAAFYHPTRRTAAPGVPGTEVFLAPHDPDFDPTVPSDATLSVDALCLNRDLPTDLPYGGGRPDLRLVEGAASVAAITPVTPPTTTLRPPLRENGFWRLISHLSLSHLSVAGGPGGRRCAEGGAAALRFPRHAGNHDGDRGADERLLAARHRARAGPRWARSAAGWT